MWVELKNSISLYPVTAIVYFTPTAQPGDQASQQVQTHSVITSTTVMVFQLERHDVPDKFQDEDFYIQVALRVNSVDGARVPKTLDTASTASKIIITGMRTDNMNYDPFSFRSQSANRLPMCEGGNIPNPYNCHRLCFSYCYSCTSFNTWYGCLLQDVYIRSINEERDRPTCVRRKEIDLKRNWSIWIMKCCMATSH